MEATQLEQISYNLQQSKLLIRQMDESVQQVGSMALPAVACWFVCPRAAALGRRPKAGAGTCCKGRWGACTAVLAVSQPHS